MLERMTRAVARNVSEVIGQVPYNPKLPNTFDGVSVARISRRRKVDAIAKLNGKRWYDYGWKLATVNEAPFTVGSITMTANSTQGIELPRGHYITRLLVTISGTVTIAGGTTNGNVVQLSPATLAKKIRIGGQHKYKGNRFPVDISGEQLFFRDKNTTTVEATLSTLADGSVQAGTAVQADLNIYFRQPHLDDEGVAGERASLDAPNFDRLDLNIDWGSSTDVIQGGDRTVTLNSITATVTAFKVVNMEPGELPITTLFQQTQLPYYGIGLTTTADVQKLLPVGGVVEAIQLVCRNGTSQYTLSDALLSNVRIKTRDVLQYDISSTAMKADERKVYGVNTNRTGLYTVALGRDPFLSGAIDATDFGVNGVNFELLTSTVVDANGIITPATFGIWPA